MVISFAKYKLPSFLKTVAVFLGLFVVYFLISYIDPTPKYFYFVMADPAKSSEALKITFMSLLPIYAYYHFTRKGLLTEQNITLYFICLLIIVTLLFVRVQNDSLAKAISMGSKREEFTNNTAYEFVQLIPLLVFFQKKPTLQYISLMYVMVFILLGMKRGAIVVGVVCVLYFMYQSYKSANRKLRNRISVLTILALIGFTYFASDFMASSDYFQYRLEATMEGNSSGRDFIYSTLFEHILSRDSIGTIIFGEGINHTVAIAGNYAHNDWLELGTNMGFLGILIYIIYFVSLTKDTLNARRTNKLQYTSLMLCLIIMFTSTMFSMSYNNLSIGITMALGYNLSHSQLKRLII